MSRKASNGKSNSSRSLGLELGYFKPLNDNQAKVFESQKHVVLNGCAGTGKSFITSYLGFRDILVEKQFARLKYIRSAVSTRALGHLPGSDSQKVEVYERPYEDIAADLFGRGDAYSILKQKGLVEFTSTSFLRGTTIRDTVLIVDECQNMTYHELDSVITRVGENCQVYICGDYFQSDLTRNGLENLHKVLNRMNCFDFVEFDTDDIVRSDFVRDYLLAKYETLGKKIIN